MRRFLIALAVIGLVAGTVYLWNASFLLPEPSDGFRFMAHRGVHQSFDRTDLGMQDCTATRMDPPTHAFLENTVPSIAEAFRLGAGMVEIDIHPTADDDFIVFHDWTIDCRTEGSGVTREQYVATLTALDVGYGYTADGGETFPFRGRGVGLMPTLAEVLGTFPNRRFLINIKSNHEEEGAALARYLKALPEARPRRLIVYGRGDQALDRLRAELPDIRTFSMNEATRCLARYLALGWSGHVPVSCRDTLVGVPLNYRRLLWGWPRRFEARMAAAGSDVVMFGRIDGETSGRGIDTLQELAVIEDDFAGLVWTDKVEVLAGANGSPPRSGGN